MKELDKMLKLESDYKIQKQEEKTEYKKNIKVIYESVYTEGLNNKIKLIKRVGYEYKNFIKFKKRWF